MYRNWMKVSLVPLLGAALWITGCSDQSAPADRLLGPDAVSFKKDGAEKGKKDKKSKKIKVKKKKDNTTAEYTLVKGKLPTKDKVVTKDIGPNGATLKLAGHRLVVPPGAVSQPTLFTMKVFKKVVDGGEPGASDDEVYVGADLKAVTYDCDGDGVGDSTVNRDLDGDGDYDCTEINVGKNGFAVPVELSLSYDWATNVADPNDLVVIWVKRSDFGEEYTTTVNTSSKHATAWLNHFSDYLLAMP